MKIKLKSITESVVVHTPTEEEAKELLQILHENGYKWNLHKVCLTEKTMWAGETTGYVIETRKHTVSWTIIPLSILEVLKPTFLTLSEFKERFIEEEEPRVRVGDKVKIKDSYYKEELHGSIGIVRSEASPFSFYVEIDNTIYQVGLNDLEPYTEPTEECPFKVGDFVMFPAMDTPLPIHEIINERAFNYFDTNGEIRCWALLSMIKPCTEPTEELNEDNFIKTENMETKELNLCEILKGHEGERFFCIMWGDADVVQFYPNGLRVATCADHDTYLNIDEHGKCDDDGICILYPSKELFMQYPLDPCTAWSIWVEEQKKYALKVECRRWNEDEVRIGVSDILRFSTSEERDKCIEEIKSVIEKYSKV